MRRRIGVLVVMTALILPIVPSTAIATTRGFELVGRHDLGGRGMNAGLAIADDCGYVGSRSGDQGSLILDLADPAAPAIIGEIPHSLGSTPRELRAVAELDLLVVLSYRLDPTGGAPNALDRYDIADCRAPVFRSRFDFGEAMPHEFFLWRDPNQAGRVLIFAAMWGHAPNLRIIDVSAAEAPVEIAVWDAAFAVGLPARLHSLTVSPDGTRAYLADWDNGLMILDTSGVTSGTGDTTPVLLTPPTAWLRLPGGNLHSAVYVPADDIVVTTQEIYGPGTCPYGRLHVIDVADPTAPRLLAEIGIAENDPAVCGDTGLRDGAFTAHNPTVVAGIAFVSWYAGGLRAIDLRDPAAPRESGVFVPEPLAQVQADDRSLGSYPVRIWSSPIVRDGLVYVVDIRNGLFVLRYTGRGASRIAGIDFAEGNAT